MNYPIPPRSTFTLPDYPYHRAQIDPQPKTSWTKSLQVVQRFDE